MQRIAAEISTLHTLATVAMAAERRLAQRAGRIRSRNAERISTAPRRRPAVARGANDVTYALCLQNTCADVNTRIGEQSKRHMLLLSFTRDQNSNSAVRSKFIILFNVAGQQIPNDLIRIMLQLDQLPLRAAHFVTQLIAALLSVSTFR